MLNERETAPLPPNDLNEDHSEREERQPPKHQRRERGGLND